MNKWYEKYDELSPRLFNWENSGQRLGDAPPFHEIRDDDRFVTDIEGVYGMDQVMRVVGYTEDQPFEPKGYKSVAIMFEDLKTFEHIWWHYEAE